MLVDAREPVVGAVGGPHDADPLAVVSAAGRLDHRGPAMGREEVAELGGVVHGGPCRDRRAERGQPLAHVQLVLGDGERRRAGVHRDAGLDQAGEHRLRHVLVIEGDHVDVAGEREDGRRIPVVTDRGRTDRRRAALDLGEHPQLDAERDRGGHHHARQLAAADDTDSHGFSGSLRKRRLDCRRRNDPIPPEDADRCARSSLSSRASGSSGRSGSSSTSWSSTC
jgi:hypothetical protein